MTLTYDVHRPYITFKDIPIMDKMTPRDARRFFEPLAKTVKRKFKRVRAVTGILPYPNKRLFGRIESWNVTLKVDMGVECQLMIAVYEHVDKLTFKLDRCVFTKTGDRLGHTEKMYELPRKVTIEGKTRRRRNAAKSTQPHSDV